MRNGAPPEGKLVINRRSFISAAAAIGGTVGLVRQSHSAEAGAAEKLARPGAKQQAAEHVPPSAEDAVAFIDHPGSDFMVDVIKSLDIEYAAAMPGSSFRGLHESIVNYGGNRAPELLTCMHEEGSVALAHGYAKATNKPMAILAHGVVGLQHAAMAVYNAWCDRVPILMFSGNMMDATHRRPGVEWAHSVQDPGALLRDCTKWDDQPASLGHFAESSTRAYKIAMTAPMGPVLITLDQDLQEREIRERVSIPRLSLTTPVQADGGAIGEAARLLCNAESPVIIADHLVRSAQGMANLVTLAELLGAPVIDKLGRFNFPTEHPLNLTPQGGIVSRADVVLALELVDLWGAVNQMSDVPGHPSRSILRPNAKLISLAVTDLYQKSNYQDFQRYAAVDLSIAGDGETSLPVLIEAVRRTLPLSKKSDVAARADKWNKLHADMRKQARLDAAYARDASPVSTARMCADLGTVLEGEDWVLVSEQALQSWWPHRLWRFDKPYQYIGGSGGYGIGYGAPAAVGAALGHRSHGRICVNIQGDGDLMCVPTILWTAAHHKIPLLTVIHNNRAFHQEMMHIQRMANRRQRGVDRAGIGTLIDAPYINYSKLAESMGVAGIGPIENPADYLPALRKALAIVKSGEPVVVDLISQPR